MVLKEAILRFLVPWTELAFNDVAVRTVMGGTSELLIGVLSRAKLYHSDRGMVQDGEVEMNPAAPMGG